MDRKQLTLTIIFASLYAVLTVALAPLSYYFFQIRFSDALIPLSIVFGMPSVYGVTVGCFVANAFGGLGLMDMILGSLVNFIASYLAYKIGRGIIGVIVATLTVGLGVGLYLGYLLGVPVELMIQSTLFGSIISISV